MDGLTTGATGQWRTCVWNDADIYGLCIRFICLALTRKLVETRGGSLEGIGSIFTLESVSRMATRTTRYSFLLWTKKLAPLYLIWAYYYWQREGLTFCSVNNIATNVSFADFINGQRKFLVLERSFLAGAQGITSRLSRGTEFCHLNLHIVLEAPRRARRNHHCNDRFFVLTWLLRGRQQ